MRSLLSFLFISSVCFSQSYNFRIYSIEEGIPQSQVHCILQDRQGFMWFGTDGGGLTRFDGKKFVSFTTTEGLSNDLVYCMTEDSAGRLWVGTNKGISLLDRMHFSAVPPALQPLASLSIRSLCTGKNGEILFGTGDGAFVFDGKSLHTLPALKGKLVLGIYADGDYTWAGTSGSGVFIYNKHQLVKKMVMQDGLKSNTVSAFLRRKNGSMLIGTENGLNVMEGDKLSFLALPTGPGSKQIIRALREDAEGNTWACTWDAGAFKISPGGTVTRYGKNEGLGSEGAFCSLTDREGNVWIGTDGNGAAKLGIQAFTSLGKQNGLADEMILSICKTRDGKWWFGHDAGLTFFDGTEYHYYGAKNGFRNEKVWSVMEDGDGSIWASTYGSGIFHFDAKGKILHSYSEKDGLSSNNVRAIFRDSRRRMWVGTASGLNLFDGKKFRVFTAADGLSGSRFLVFHEDKNHNLWVGSSGGGISKLVESGNKISFTSYTEKEGLADNVVLCITEDEQGNIWTANFGGISLLDPASGKIKNITKKDGLASNTVYSLTFSDKDHLLICSNNGVDKLDVKAWKESGKVHTKHFSKEEGFSGVECNTNSIYKDVDGRIWIGTIKGAFIYDPKKDVENQTEPLTHITNVRLFFENFNFNPYADSSSNTFLPAHITLPYSMNHLTFDFAGLSFTVPKKVKYRYMIEGFDKNFTNPVSENFATYSNLPPGNYIFKVIACNNDGKWNTAPATFRFSITPPFWLTWWFTTAMVASLALSVYGVFRMRIRRLRQVQLMLEHQVELKTSELRREKEIVEKQNKLIEKKNESITSSIRYARRIQNSILPLKEKLNELIPSSFILFKPKDIVSGDFYWFSKVKTTDGRELVLVAAVDCTGHGVPGAFMSLIGNNLLNGIVTSQKITDPQTVLEKLHEGVVQALKKGEQESGTVDGMDITLCVLDMNKHEFEFSSTGRPLILVKGRELQKIKVGKHPVGLVTRKEARFEKEKLQLNAGDAFYIFTDGYCDQFGGEEDDKFMENNLEKLLLQVQDKSMNEQSIVLENAINAWKGDRPQLDDILVIGIKV